MKQLKYITLVMVTYKNLFLTLPKLNLKKNTHRIAA